MNKHAAKAQITYLAIEDREAGRDPDPVRALRRLGLTGRLSKYHFLLMCDEYRKAYRS